MSRLFKENFTNSTFIEDDFNSEVFNEDLLYEMVSDMFADDPLIKVRNKKFTPEGYSRIVLINGVNDIVRCGGSEPAEPFYHIIPDFTPVDIAIDNFEKFWAGSMAPFQFIPVANPIIPDNKFFSEDDKTFEISWLKKGLNIYDPTPGQSVAIEKVYQDVPMSTSPVYLDRYCLVSQEEVKKDKKKVYVQMQFNPFHPSSISRIVDHVFESEFEITGHWRYRNKISFFKFNLYDRRYRIHSHDWLQYFDGISDDTVEFLRCFDLVSFDDFFQIGKLMKSVPMVAEIGIKIQSFSTTKVAKHPYSVIGPWEGKMAWIPQRSGKIYVPYMSHPVTLVSCQETFCERKFRVEADKVVIDDHGFDVPVSLIKGVLNSKLFYSGPRGGADVVFMPCKNKKCRLIGMNTVNGNVVGALRRCENQESRVHKKVIREMCYVSLIPSLDQVMLRDVLEDLAKPIHDRKMKLEKWGIVGDRQSSEIIMDNELEEEFHSVRHSPVREGVLPHLSLEEEFLKNEKEELDELEKNRKAAKSYESSDPYKSRSNLGKDRDVEIVKEKIVVQSQVNSKMKASSKKKKKK